MGAASQGSMQLARHYQAAPVCKIWGKLLNFFPPESIAGSFFFLFLSFYSDIQYVSLGTVSLLLGVMFFLVSPLSLLTTYYRAYVSTAPLSRLSFLLSVEGDWRLRGIAGNSSGMTGW